MTHSVLVKSLRQSYRIVVGDGLLAQTGSYLKSLGMRGKAMIVTQQAVGRRYLKPLQSSLKKKGYESAVCYVPQGERAKSQTELFRLFSRLLAKKYERGDFLIALGGGIVGDLAGFASAVYLRGVGFVNVPTTLLAQVDSAIGGKTAINLKEGKNLVGAFYPPRIVLSDIDTLATLPRRDLRSSMAEVIKYGVIRDPKLFSLLEKKTEKEVLGSRKILAQMVGISSAIKGRVVSNDEFESSGERMILNYGHTFGHAFEKVLGFKTLMHGEAVAAGMICAARLGVRLGMFSAAAEKKQAAVIKKYSLPASLARYRVSAASVMKAMLLDKKVKGGKLRFVLPRRIGKVEVVTGVPSGDVVRSLIEAGARK